MIIDANHELVLGEGDFVFCTASVSINLDKLCYSHRLQTMERKHSIVVQWLLQNI